VVINNFKENPDSGIGMGADVVSPCPSTVMTKKSRPVVGYQKYSEMEYTELMNWQVQEHEEYSKWFEAQKTGIQNEILAVVRILSREGPTLSRPYVDTLQGSEHPNLKELRVQYRGEPWRILFAFDPERRAILLLGGNKTGNKRWYLENIPLADVRFTSHLNQLAKLQKEQQKQEQQDGNLRRADGKSKSRKTGKNRGKNR
jgi:hypothetical protein